METGRGTKGKKLRTKKISNSLVFSPSEIRLKTIDFPQGKSYRERKTSQKLFGSLVFSPSKIRLETTAFPQWRLGKEAKGKSFEPKSEQLARFQSF